MRRKRGLVYLWTGEGAGKTTSALGVALRCAGHNLRVVVIQFLKGQKEIGEYKVQKKLKPFYEIHQFGRSEFINPSNPDPIDLELAKKGLEFAKKTLKKKPFLIILDEVNLVTGPKKIHGKRFDGLLNVNDVIDFLDMVPPETTIYLTGRYAPKELIERVDFATEIREIKHPFKEIPARKGIEY